jgi:molybdenum cofactor biosynthesis enzyme MoaA
MHFDLVQPPPLPVLWHEDDLPHCVIEVNQRCNISCFGCYKDKNSQQKTVTEVKAEIDLMMAARNLSTLSFAGGEPLLHPQLEELVAYTADHNIRPIVVTNGTLLTAPRLSALKAAGLAGVLLHIDRLQGKRPDSPVLNSEDAYNSLRAGYLRLCHEHELDTGLAVTLYQENLTELLDVLDLGQRTPGVKYMLLTGYSDVANLNTREDARFERVEQTVTSEHFFRMMQERQGTSPAMFLPSSHRDEEMRWLFYLTAVSLDHRGNLQRFPFSGLHRRGLEQVLALDRKKEGRFSFDKSPTALEVGLMTLVLAFSTLSPGEILRALIFLGKALVAGNLKLYSVVFQHSPQMMENGEYEICRHCPDATVRNGEIVPVCLADILHPLPG